MSEEVYNSIPSLIDKIKVHTGNLENGKLPYDSLEEMLDNARELYDRLVVLRYKAYEEMVKEESEPESVVVKKEEKIVEEEVLPSVKPLSMRFKMSPPVSEVIEEKETAKIIEPQEPKVNKPVPSQKEINQQPTVNDRLSKRYDEESLVKKLQKAPINDLKSAIGINQKFLFIQDLFNGDVDAYGRAITKLNEFNNFKEASHFLRNELASEYKWSTENQAVSAILELVERRYF